ncbi:molecular chaperone GrpE [Parelusimicrobium proximum]|uniref:nucleotide exchange factor GrpE n=1 Tax=Parelusimicrobium proximum TaxID=3228953 RepID=UPI003D171A2F
MTKKNKAEKEKHETKAAETAAEQEEIMDEESEDITEEGGKTEAVLNKAAEYMDQLVRLKADFENYRKRVEKEREMLVRLGQEKTIAKFLSLYDSMQKAKEQISKDSTCSDNVKSGIDMMIKELNKIFQSEDVKTMETKGKPYDPMSQEVITTIPSTPENDGVVLEEIQPGFTLNDHVIRPARVCIGKCDDKEEEK